MNLITDYSLKPLGSVHERTGHETLCEKCHQRMAYHWKLEYSENGKISEEIVCPKYIPVDIQ